MAKALHEMNGVWMNTLSKNGIVHKATQMRRLLPDYSRTLKRLSGVLLKNYGRGWIEPYKENWRILNLD